MQPIAYILFSVEIYFILFVVCKHIYIYIYVRVYHQSMNRCIQEVADLKEPINMERSPDGTSESASTHVADFQAMIIMFHIKKENS